MKKRKTFTAILLLALVTWGIGKIAELPAYGMSPTCTIFTVSDGDTAFFGNNEDNDDARQGRIWFYPAKGDKHGVVLFGYSVGGHADIPVGGMNDQGLVVDSNALHFTRIALHPDKERYPGSFFVGMLEACSTVEDVKTWAQGYDLLFLETQQAHVADRFGNAVVLGLDQKGELYITKKSGNTLVSTNFSLAQNPNGRYNDERYKTASTMLGTMESPTLEGSADILKETALSIIMYSYVVDLQNGVITLFSRGNFDHSATLNIAEELAKGAHSYDIEALVRQQTGVARGAMDTTKVAPLLIIGVGLVLGGLLYGIWRRSGIQSAKRLALLAGALFCLMILSRTWLRIPIHFAPIPNLVTVTFYLSFMAAFVYLTGMTFRPWLAGTLCMLGLVVSEAVHCLVYGCSDELLPYIIFALSSYGIAAWIVAAFRGKRMWTALLLGWIWTFIGFYLPVLYYYSVFVEWEEYVLLYALILAGVNLLSIPVALILNRVIQMVFKIKRLDEWILGSRESDRLVV